MPFIFCRFLEEPQQILEAMLETANLPDLRGYIQSVLVLNSLKLYCKLAVKWLSETLKGTKVDTPELKLEGVKPSLLELQNLTKRILELTNFLMDKISQFVHSANLEVQERVRIGFNVFSTNGLFKWNVTDSVLLDPGCFHASTAPSDGKTTLEASSSK